jgi:hypothetical protein
MKKVGFTGILGLAMLFIAVGTFAQEVTISGWGYGLEASMGVISGNEPSSNCSVSFQGFHDSGAGFSLDYIKGPELANSGGLLVNSGLLGSAFLGLRLSKFFTQLSPHVYLSYFCTGAKFLLYIVANKYFIYRKENN